MQCKHCNRPATVETIDGDNYCDQHLPADFCPGCGELTAGIFWHEMHIAQHGVCADCLEYLDSETMLSIEPAANAYFFAY